MFWDIVVKINLFFSNQSKDGFDCSINKHSGDIVIKINMFFRIRARMVRLLPLVLGGRERLFYLALVDEAVE